MDSRLARLETANSFILECGGVREPYAFCDAVLAKVRELVSYDQAVFFMLDGNRKITRSHFVDFSEKWISLYLKYYSHSVPKEFSFEGEAREVGGRGAVRLCDWRNQEDVDKGILKNYIKPRMLSQTVAITLFDPNSAPSVVFCLDRLRGGTFSEDELELVRLITAHLSNLYKNLLVRLPDQVYAWHGTIEVESLTQREREVLDLLCQGVKPSFISKSLCISIGTTNKHIAHIYKKFGVNSKQELLVRLLGV